MQKAKRIRRSITDIARLKIKKTYEKKLLKSAVALCFYHIKYRTASFFANAFFSGRNQKANKFLLYANRLLNKDISRCYRTAEKCEWYKQKIEQFS